MPLCDTRDDQRAKIGSVVDVKHCRRVVGLRLAAPVTPRVCSNIAHVLSSFVVVISTSAGFTLDMWDQVFRDINVEVPLELVSDPECVCVRWI